VTRDEQNMNAVQLIEGLTHKGDLKAFGGKEYFKIYVRWVKGHERQINIQVAPETGNWQKISVKPGLKFPDNDQDYQWHGLVCNLKITPGETGYLQEGWYLVMIQAVTNILQSTKNTDFKYTISYFSEENFIYLKSMLPLT
jgi:hypothetical protein